MVEKRDYSTAKITITLPKYLIAKLEKVKMYPKWKNNRSAVVEAGVLKLFEEEGIINEATKKETKVKR
ncbi:MAG: hypothetical protein GY861_16995 [bacterium]|nr:hypothetical protein [bacterium]